ncbi:MAG: response regulator [Calditrichaeota bacterium]|nr:MAG: response regulator [Calditrichota bacterium]MBL1207831.1 response regulator [Calditrichota bacterium]NOG47665.1 response regulator [Calditrichota bacterium]
MQNSLSDCNASNNSLKAKILLIEDEELIRELYADALRHSGFELILVEDGEKGLEKWQQDKFSMLITDIGLPGMSGWEVIESIRKKNNNVPIIIISGWGNQVEFIRGKELNVSHILSKPIDLLSLTSTINECLHQTSQNISASN